ncbi:ATP-dependent nuclease [Ekhidna sp.]|uniref:ATP-dependent nuclease n=1 Tax=Ekhidna sp. TaxID=2608089 RepID=UPI003B5BEF2E
MRFEKFEIKNFKGIDQIEIEFDKSPKANVFTLVGLNESGKTTILEAINFFSPSNAGLSALELPGTKVEDFNNLIPIGKRDNFNGRIELIVKLALEDEDFKKIEKFAKEETQFRKLLKLSHLSYFRYYNFKDSKFTESDHRWTGWHGVHKDNKKDEFINISSEAYEDDNLALSGFCKKLIPSILYFPNFLFDFPARIKLESDEELSEKDKFYLELIQDILFSLKNDTNIKDHIIERSKSDEKNDKRNLDSLLKKMNRKVTEVVFDAWNKIFNRQIDDTEVVIKCESDSDNTYLEFEIEGPDGIYQINERSLGFRWFFTFLLFTQFRPYRKDSPKNVMFLFDEPASNLHSSAQQELLKSFEKLMEDCKIIYTTHSHHLINPNWLESTYVVKNEGLDLETLENYSSRQTTINITPYREFVSKNPSSSAYFQPVLDVLEYVPSKLENIPSCVFLEGKNDYYTLEYFRKIILKNVKDLNLAPSTGSGNLDQLISLYLGWGRQFIVLLDSDKSGTKEKKRYLDKFGSYVGDRIFTLEDINKSWNGHSLEKLIDQKDRLQFQKLSYPSTTKFNKTHFNRTIQEMLIKKRKYSFSKETASNFKKMLDFMTLKLDS